MQLRTTKKTKDKNKDLGYELKPVQNNKRQVNRKNEKDNQSCNENSNESNENEVKKHHQLRNTSKNFQGKYKKMNSGKYLYKSSIPDKKPPSVIKKKQLKHIPTEVISQLKDFLMHLHKKEEENLLSRKKRREEEKTKPKQDKHQKRSFKTSMSMQNNPSFGYRQSFDMSQMNYYPSRLFNSSEVTMHSNNPNQGVFMVNYNGMNHQSMYNFNHNDYTKIFNYSYIEDAVKRGVVNNIIGALYIKHAQKNKGKANNHDFTKKIVPLCTVQFNESPVKNETSRDYTGLKDNMANFNDKMKEIIQCGDQAIDNQEKQVQTQQKQANTTNTLFKLKNDVAQSSKEDVKDNNQTKETNKKEPQKKTILNEPNAEMDSLIETQLNTMNNVIKSIKDNEISKIFETK